MIALLPQEVDLSLLIITGNLLVFHHVLCFIFFYCAAQDPVAVSDFV